MHHLSDNTQPALCFQQPQLLTNSQQELYIAGMPKKRKPKKNQSPFGQRLEKAMEYAGFETDVELAVELTKLLHKHRQLPINRSVPFQTIQSARTRVKDVSKYTTHLAALCKVNPLWLAFDQEPMVTKDHNDLLSRPGLKDRYEALDANQKLQVAHAVELKIMEFVGDVNLGKKQA